MKMVQLSYTQLKPSGTAVQVEDYDANFGSGMPFVLGLLERQYKKRYYC